MRDAAVVRHAERAERATGRPTFAAAGDRARRSPCDVLRRCPQRPFAATFVRHGRPGAPARRSHPAAAPDAPGPALALPESSRGRFV
ncbi:hypothetical protein BUC_3669 [Burkholderia pseudomallei 576]|nr:hypothetical protein BUC_3669 [Burkholderia pseudomallei 576]